MYRYIDEISKIAQGIIEKYIENKSIAIDCTLGNGYDTDFLAKYFKKVYSFDIQKEACEKYKNKKKNNVIIINESHHKLREFIKEKDVNCLMYNLGFLPGSGKKEITTRVETTVESIKQGLGLLSKNGIMTICVYIGHDEGKVEEACINELLESLPKEKFAVLEQRYINRSSIAPRLFVIEKNS
ncbi:MAG: tRNA (mnm(5)s(2)U34)-methyltransferase [Romboutsia sp.]|uniref:tRNA (mnm(5)s(2)U34)-methyltransferase n=1 Tax=Romboutsia sp. TaxID=1965302 RepID=UPI003F372ED6